MRIGIGVSPRIRARTFTALFLFILIAFTNSNVANAKEAWKPLGKSGAQGPLRVYKGVFTTTVLSQSGANGPVDGPRLGSAGEASDVIIIGGTSGTGYGSGTGTGSGTNSGVPGPRGLSAYEVAVKNGFQGTEVQWLASLRGPSGPEGQVGSVGAPGPVGPTGPAGATGSQGPAGAAGGGGGGSTGGGTGTTGPQGPTGATGGSL